MVWLGLLAGLAGFIDAIAGGGGLIQLPALLVFQAQLPIPVLLGTNKLASIAGTSVAVVQYSQRVPLNWRLALASALTAFIFALAGAATVQRLDPSLLRPLVLLLLLGVTAYTLSQPTLGLAEKPPVQHPYRYGLGLGAIIGFYDGFLGPGTGSFLTFGLIALLGFDFLQAAATTKVINFATNLAALLYFGSTGAIAYSVAVPMALCNLIGGWLGARFAIAKGSRWVRWLFLGVTTALLLKLAYDTAN